jgi:hypothetical protein
MGFKFLFLNYFSSLSPEHRVERHSSRYLISSSMMFEAYCRAPTGKASPVANLASKARLNAAAASS